MRRFSLPAALTLALALLLSAFGGVAFAQDSTFEVELGEFYIDMPATLPAGPITLEVTNAGSMPHTLTIQGNGVTLQLGETLSGGGAATWELDLEPGSYTIWCPIPGHRDAGMELTLTVEGAAPEPTPVPADPTATPAEADPTPTVAGDEYTEPVPMTPTPEAAADADATATALPTLPATGAGGSQSDGLSNGMLAMLAMVVLAVAATGGGLLYRWQKQVG
jgi:plastocyanin